MIWPQGRGTGWLRDKEWPCNGHHAFPHKGGSWGLDSTSHLCWCVPCDSHLSYQLWGGTYSWGGLACCSLPCFPSCLMGRGLQARPRAEGWQPAQALSQLMQLPCLPLLFYPTTKVRGSPWAPGLEADLCWAQPVLPTAPSHSPARRRGATRCLGSPWFRAWLCWVRCRDKGAGPALGGPERRGQG